MIDFSFYIERGSCIYARKLTDTLLNPKGRYQMQAFITASGILNVVPENDTELYALMQWKLHALIQVNDVEREEERYFRGSRLSIPHDLPKS